MPTTDLRVDAFIARSADFAKPILVRVREMVHEACPEVEETIKWGSPFFDYKGQMMCAIGAFKQHCALIFWKASLIEGLPANGDKSRGSFGRVTSVKELLTKKQFTGFSKAAMALNGEAAEGRIEARGQGSQGARSRAREEQEGDRGVRDLSTRTAPRVLRLDQRGEARGDEGEARAAGRRVDRRGQVAELEVLAVLPLPHAVGIIPRHRSAE